MFLGQPAWSPDGKHVAWVAGPANGYGTVWVSDVSGQNARPLHQFGQSLLGVDSVGQIAWLSPKSLLVDAQLSEKVRLFRPNLSGRLTPLAGRKFDLSFSIDRARRLIATQEYTSGCGFLNCPAAIDILHLATGKVTQSGSKGDLNMFPALSPDGQRVAYERSVCPPGGDCQNPHGIWLAAASGTGRPREIARTGEYPTWSPDGRTLAYIVETQKQFLDLAIVRPGERPRTLPRAASNPVFSPDSRLLAYDGLTNSGSWGSNIDHLVILNLRTHRAVLVSPRWLGNIDAQSWSPNGEKLIVAAGPTGSCTSLYTVTLRSGRWKLLQSC